jgi:UDP-GlcNAc:undecaprenyl-phosphate/decaprenyl-phosphate GlcNAc-1-phosphate transferase
MGFLISLGGALVLTPVAGAVGSAMGLVDRPRGDLKIHTQPIPLSGGAAVVAAAGLSLAVGGQGVPWGLVGGVLVAFAGGLIDDVLPLPAGLRIVVLVAAGMMVSLGSAIGGDGAAEVFGLTLLVVACSNAVNILDGQDGLVGGLAAIAALGLAVLGARTADATAVVLALGTAGSLLGFLPWNWPRAHIFLGNGGAYAVGVVLAYLAARVTAAEGWSGFLAAGACLGVFAFEVLFTAIRRLLAGGAITAGDRLHSYDLLSRLLGRHSATVGFWAGGMVAAGLGVLILGLSPAVGAVVVVGAAMVAGGWGILLWTRQTAVT